MVHSRTMKIEATHSLIVVVVVEFLLLVLYSAGVLVVVVVVVVANLEAGYGAIITEDIDDNEDRTRILLLHGRSRQGTEETAGDMVDADVDRLRRQRCLCSLNAIMLLP